MPISTLITATGASTWTVPPDCPAGTTIVVETWGAGAGGSGRVASTFGASGAGGAYAKENYVVTANDVTNGVPYTVGAGSAGTSGANPLAGGFTLFGTNVIGNSNMTGAVTGTLSGGSPTGTVPTGWLLFPGTVALTTSITTGTNDVTTGFNYVDFTLSGTPAATSSYVISFDLNTLATNPQVTIAAWMLSGYFALVGGSATNFGAFQFAVDGQTVAGPSGYVSTPLNISTILPLTGALVRKTATASFAATTATAHAYLRINVTSGSAVNGTFRIAGLQLQPGSSATTFMPTPGLAYACGGYPPQATTGGIAGPAAASIGSVAKFSGGGGAAFNASGSGGGGGAGAAGAGVTGNTSGQGGAGDNSSGGAGGAVKATSPGNPGTANVEGGGGGGGLTTVSGTGGAGAAPGGGAGGAAVATGTGGTGARGQLRIAYPDLPNKITQNAQLQPIMAQ